MNKSYSTVLPSEEIFVIAGFLGYGSVFGIKENRTFDLLSDVKNAVSRLERGGALRYGLDGRLYIRPEFKTITECMCEADAVGVFTTNLKRGKSSTTYIFRKNSNMVLLEETENGEYKAELTDKTAGISFPEELLSAECGTICESLPFKEAEIIRGLQLSFDTVGAEERLRGHLKDGASLSVMLSLLSGNCGFMSAQIYKRTDILYSLSHSSITAVAEAFAVAVTDDENDILHFESTAPDKLCRQMTMKLTEGTF